MSGAPLLRGTALGLLVLLAALGAGCHRAGPAVAGAAQWRGSGRADALDLPRSACRDGPWRRRAVRYVGGAASDPVPEQATPLLLLDEPTTFLDLVRPIEVLALLRRRNRETGLTEISVLHDLNFAGRFSDLLVLLGPAGLVASGTPSDVLTAAHLEAAYGLRSEVHRDPVTGTPLVLPH